MYSPSGKFAERDKLNATRKIYYIFFVTRAKGFKLAKRG